MVHRLLQLLLIIFITSSAVSCKKCKECYFIEESSGSSSEISLGEFCGDEIEEKESEEFIAVDGEAYIECR